MPSRVRVPHHHHTALLVVGAHYDTVPGTPGADDNASGVAGLLALAGTLAGSPPVRTVRCVAFALEEPPVYRTRRMASYRYAQSLREAGTRVGDTQPMIDALQEAWTGKRHKAGPRKGGRR